jgi:hypothetical protein
MKRALRLFALTITSIFLCSMSHYALAVGNLTFVNGTPQSLTVCQNAAATSINAFLTASDDQAGETLTWSVFLAPTHGVLGGFNTTATSVVGNSTPSGLTYTPTGGYSGGDVFQIQVSNGINSAFTQINITVQAAPAPTFISSPGANTCTSTPVTYTTQSGGGLNSYTWSVPGVAGTDYTITAGGIGGASSTVTISWITTGSKTVTVNYKNLSGCIGVSPASNTTTVNARPTPSFTVTPGASTCAGTSVTYTTQTGGGINTYVWGVPGTAGTDYTITSGGIGSGNNTVTLFWITSGSKTVTVNYSNASNCTGLVNATNSTTVNARPVPTFTTAPAATTCIGSSVTYTTQTGGGINTYIWNVPGIAGTNYTITAGGIGSASNTVTLTWLTSGSQTVTVNYTDINGCTGASPASNTVTVNSRPVPTFTSSPGASTCAGTNVTYTTQTGGGIGSYVWSVPGVAGTNYTITAGGIGGASNTVTLFWITGGSKTVTVNYTDVNGCTGASAASNTTTVNAPAPTFTSTPGANVCAGTNVTYTTQTGGGITNYVWSVPGTAGVDYNITAGGIGAGSNTVTLNWLTAGNQTVTVNYTDINGCTGLNPATNTTNVQARPVPAFSTAPSANSCVGINVTYTTQAGQSAYIWSVPGIAGTNYNITSGGIGAGSNTVTLNWITTGSKTVTVNFTDANGCTGASAGSNTTIVNSIPTPTFTVAPGASTCAGTPVAYTTQTGGGINSYVWNVPGTAGVDYNVTAGGTGSGSNTVTINWITGGSKTVTVNYNNIAGCTGSSAATNTTTVHAPAPTFTSVPATPACAGVGSTYTTQAGQASYSWSVPGIAGTDYTITSGGIGSGSNTVTLNWITTGSKTVTVNYTDAFGCTGVSAASNTSTVSLSPAAITGPGSVCTGSTITLSDVTGGGTWTSSTPAMATIGSTTGIVTGYMVGTPSMFYTLGSGCAASVVVTVNQTPTGISGTFSSCTGGTTTLTNGYSGGVWTSSATGVATIGSATGIVNALTPGTSTITYTLPGGCTATVVYTVNPIPAAIGGASNVCVAATTTLTDATASGVWTSSNTAVATIWSGAGIVNGITAGTTTISYTLATGCFITAPLTVNPNPAAITGPTTVCSGSTITLATTTLGVSWTSSNAIIATVASGTGVVTGVSAGSATITCGIVTTGCFATYTITVNPLPATIAGTSTVCVGLTTTLTDATGTGSWTSGTPAMATINSSTGVVTGVASGTPNITYTLPTGCFTIQQITVNPLPAAISGSLAICPGTSTGLTDATAGGTWASSNTSVATMAGSVATGVSAGTSTITYTLPTGCITTAQLTVNPNPAAITGTAVVCQGLTTTLADGTGGGTWTSATPANATVGSATGIVTGVTGATTTAITYTLPTGCIASLVVTINPLPAAIAGANTVCTGLTTPLTDATGLTAWSSSNTALATIGSGSGVVTGVSAGALTITYTNPANGCVATLPFTVNPTPATITGATNVCVGFVTTLADASGGGTWSASNGNATVGSANGVVNGVTNGTLNIVYTLPAGCIATLAFTVNPTPSAISTSVATNFSTPGAYSYVVPAGIFSVNVSASGAQGGGYVSGGLGLGGNGGNVQGALSVVPGQQLFIFVGAQGGANSGGAGGSSFGGGEDGGVGGTSSGGAGGGAASDVRTSITGGSAGVASLNSRVFVGGGGGAGNFSCGPHINGGIGGFPSGGNGVPSCSTAPTGGSQIAGGIATCYSGNCGTNGGQGVGGGATFWGGGGGGGYFGGAGSGEASGAGGSSFAGAGTSGVVYNNGVQTAGGIVSISYPVAITSVCVGSTVLLTDATAGGTWTSSNTAIATVGAATGVVTGVSSGSVVFTYSVATGCAATLAFTVNPTPSANTGSASVCTGQTTTLANSTSGGTWTSATTANATVGSATGVVSGLTGGTTSIISYTLGTGCFANTTVTVNTTPAAITGASSVCTGATTTLSSATGAGVWTSSSTTKATVGAASGIVTGVAVGTLNITYTLGSCFVIYPMTVNQTPPAIAGNQLLCIGLSTTLSDGTGGGVWTSLAPGIASIGSANGVATGVSAGTTSIVYTLPGGCNATLPVSVNVQPATIAGSSTLCTGATTTLTNATAGGAWSASNSLVLVGTGTGIVTGVSAGNVTITYTMPGSCISVFPMTINLTPAAITGTPVVCVGSTTTLSDATSGGTWSSSNGALAGVGSASGIVTGIAAGNPNIIYTYPGGCNATIAITVNALPTVVSVTGGGPYCAGGPGAHVGLSNSTSGINYQLFLGTATSGGAVAGIGGALDFGFKTAAGIYTVVATNTTTGCNTAMSGNATISINPIPFAYTVTGGGSYCSGTTSTIHVGLSSSAAFGATYQLFNSGTPVSSLAGTGVLLDFGIQSAAGTYTVVGTITATGCTNTMAGSPVISVNAVPAIHNVTLPAGGSYCAGGSGVHIGIDTSDIGFSYQLFLGGATSGSPSPGTGVALDFGLRTTAGSYTVLATNNTTGCSVLMNGTAVVTVNPLPTVFNVTAPTGAGYCAGGTGVDIVLSGSTSGYSYQLLRNGVNTGSVITGTGGALDMLNQVTGGVYTVQATSLVGCAIVMNGSITVSVNPLPTAFSINVTGGGVYCAGGTGQRITLSGSTIGVSYQLSNGFGPVTGGVLTGTGLALDFGLQTAVSTYSVSATNISTGCTNSMTGSVSITTNPLPTLYPFVSPAGNFCIGGAGIDVQLTNSDAGVTYQLYLAASTVGAAIVSAGGALDFGIQTIGGTYTVQATNPTGCTAFMTGSTIITVNSLPLLFNMNGGGSFCNGGTGVPVGLSGSEVGVNYQLFSGGAGLGTSAGTGSGLSFGLQTTAGAYTVVATSTFGCINNMTGSSVVNVNPLPSVYTVTGGAAYCAGGAGTHIGLSGSDIGVNYQLFLGGSTSGAAVAGTGGALDFGLLTSSVSTYTVSATNIATTCVNNMSGSITVTTNPLPASFTVGVSGSSSYCAGGAGVMVTLSGSVAGVNYQLYRGPIAIGSFVAGTGAGILNMGLQTVAGTYTVVASDAVSGCTQNMAGSATISINPLPTDYTVTGGGGFCTGGTGVNIGLTSSDAGIVYALNRGGTLVTSVTSTGTPFNFGLQTIAGTYTVMATNPVTSCTVNMLGSAVVTINTPPASFPVSAVGTGHYCPGGTGVNIILSGSVTGVNYQLLFGGVPVGSPIPGTTLGLSFGAQTTAGSYTVRATNAITGCTALMTGSATVIIDPLPISYNVTGGGNYCPGSVGVNVGLSLSAIGTQYQLFNSGTLVSSLSGIGAPLDFGPQTTPGVYTVLATSTSPTACFVNMAGSATVNISALPTLYAVAGGGSYCQGGDGLPVSLMGSDIGTNYQLYNSDTVISGIYSGTGAPLNFGLQTAAGSYMVVATSTLTTCVDSMFDITDIVVNPLPVVHTVSNSGSYCAGGAGSPVSIDASETGINYQLFFGGFATGSPVPGTGLGLNFGLHTAAGIYTVAATNTATLCASNMAGSDTIFINSLPAIYAATGGGAYCAGGPGRNVGLSNSHAGVVYQLYRGTTMVGVPDTGTGAAISFGIQTIAGIYTVAATSLVTGCSGNMAGSATITTNPLPTAYIVTGGGGYCTGGTGVHIGLSGSATGVTYQLWNGGATSGSPLIGTGLALDFGIRSVAGAYKVIATATATSCTANMMDSVMVNINALPTLYTVTAGATSYCTGGTGVVIYISGTDLGVNYQLYRGATPVGIPIAGTGTTGLDFGPQTIAAPYTVVATNGSTGCTSTMSGAASFTISPLPPAFTVTGGGSYCLGGDGANIGLSSSNSGISYQLYRGGLISGTAVNGTGGPLDLGLRTVAGTYTVIATNTVTGCTNNMIGSATVGVNSLPVVYTVTGGGSYCAGGSGITLNLSGSVTGINYRLYASGAPVGGFVPGTGLALHFAAATAAGVYIITATNTATGCADTMAGAATVVVNDLPATFIVTGGGSFCPGGLGMHVGLYGSVAGINYQLYNGTSAVGTAVHGTGLPIDFGLQTAIGNYTVVARDTSSACTQNMTGSANVAFSPLPSVYNVTGGGAYCIGGTGVNVGLDGSNSGVAYQLYFDGSAVGTPAYGTGSVVSFGNQTVAGSYTVIATSTATTCVNSMLGGVVVSVNPLITPAVSISTVNADTACAGIVKMFTASPVNGGSAPAYQWMVNGLLVSSSDVYSFVPATGDVVSVMLTSNAACATPDTASSVMTMTVLPQEMPAIVVAAVPGNVVCRGSSVTFTATADNGGSAPTYAWKKNGFAIVAAPNSPVYSYIPADGEVISCLLTSNYQCRLANSVISNGIIMEVDTPITPSVTITVSPINYIVTGETVTFTATVDNAVKSPAYQWYVNGHFVPGATLAVYSDNIFTDLQVVKCIVTSGGGCGGTPGTSNSIIMHVSTVGVHQVKSNNIDVQLVPNPNKGLFTLKGDLGTAQDQEVTVDITNMLGQVIYTGKVIAHNGIINDQVKLANTLANGMYIVNLNTASGNKVFHMVIEQ